MTKERGHSIMDERKADRMELSGVAGNAGGMAFQLCSSLMSSIMQIVLT